MRDRETHCRPSAHRLAHDVRAVRAEVVENREQVVRGRTRVREPVVVGRQAEAALIPGDDAVVACELGHLLEPDAVIAPGAVAQHEHR